MAEILHRLRNVNRTPVTPILILALLFSGAPRSGIYGTWCRIYGMGTPLQLAAGATQY